MPFYEYQCQDCHQLFEILQKISDKPKRKCETCGGKLKKLISQSAFQLKGSGWYVTDFKGDNKKSEAKDTPEAKPQSSEKKTVEKTKKVKETKTAPEK